MAIGYSAVAERSHLIYSNVLFVDVACLVTPALSLNLSDSMILLSYILDYY